MHKLTLPEGVIGQRVKCPNCEADFEAHPEAKVARDEELPAPTAPPETGRPQPTPLNGAYSESARPSRRTAPTMYCVECGTRFDRAEDRCPGCGWSLDEVALERQPRRPRWRDLPPLRGSLAIICAILLPVGFVLFIVGIILINTIGRNQGGDDITVLGCVLAWLLAGVSELAALVCCMIWLYQACRIVAHEEDDVSPGLKVGLLFVPVFNIYWMFSVILGLSSAIRNELHYVAPTRSHNTGWVPGLLACILMVIPYLQSFAVCMFIAWMLLANNALQRLIRYHQRLRAEAGELDEPTA
jgi:hypothetical protein